MRFADFLIVVFILTLFLNYGAAMAEDSVGDVKISEGMELRKSGGVNVLMPKGAKINRVGNVNLIEGTDEYAAQGFAEVEKRLQKIESNQEKMEARITALENYVKEER